MEGKAQECVTCQVCGKTKTLSQVWPGEFVRGPVLEAIKKRCPGWSTQGYICLKDLNRFRSEYVEDVLEAQRGELSSLESQVVKSLEEHEVLSTNLNIMFDQGLTFGQKASDKLTEFGGSWAFVISYVALVAAWVLVNTAFIIWEPFDPYPFIFLNLVLSGVAGIQAPIILMSQNRQDAKDRMRSEHDYRLNLKAELEIRHLNEKVDLLLTTQWKRLLEIQQIQIDIMEEMAGGAGHQGASPGEACPMPPAEPPGEAGGQP